MKRSTFDLTQPGWSILLAITVLMAIGVGSICVTDTHYAAGHDGPQNAAKQVVRALVSVIAAMIVIKLLSRTESSITITAYMNIFLSLFSLGPALWVWVAPSPEMWGWLVVIAVIGTIAQLALTQALKETEPTAVLPFDFLKLVWATLLGMWVFGELPDLITWIGAMVVFASGFFLAWREYQERRRAGNRALAAASQPPP